MTPLDRAVLTRSNGRFTVLGPIGAPTLLLVTTGAKSGQERTSPLLYGRDGDQLIVVGSNWGQPHHPAWTGNLIKQPEAEVIMGGRRIAVHARLLAGDEAEAAYRKMIAVNSVYAAYRGRTDRAIRVFTLAAISPLP
jgi:deazaflavin-dependent oxidoreductase (nitroreductase family)